jgi:2-desacetyl-2-hydroxyethyl bacteriochlorophyllide A dehydrogenase
MMARMIYFTAPRRVEVREEELPVPQAGEVVVRSLCSGVSQGTEKLIYQGLFPKGLETPNDPYSNGMQYPLRYGYASVGEVIEMGPGVAKEWQGARVFSCQPHGSHFTARTEVLQRLPEGCPVERACFLANMETSVNLVLDTRPLLGEAGVVLGQGVVGLMTAGLLAEFPLKALFTSDLYPRRREASEQLGVTACLDPYDSLFNEKMAEAGQGGLDFVIELTGVPEALNTALSMCGFGSRVVIGSWYGNRRTALDLGGQFHRSRIQLISSQVSTIGGPLSERWDKARRFEAAWAALDRIKPERWVTHRFPIEQADQAYRLLDESSEQVIQILFEYG